MDCDHINYKLILLQFLKVIVYNYTINLLFFKKKSHILYKLKMTITTGGISGGAKGGKRGGRRGGSAKVGGKKRKSKKRSKKKGSKKGSKKKSRSKKS